jgi:hypothetical protein
MLDPKTIDDLARRVSDSLPPGFQSARQDLHDSVRSSLQGAFHRMDLVTREEFEVQAGVLARTRAKLEALEQRVSELEARLEGDEASAPGTIGGSSEPPARD